MSRTRLQAKGRADGGGGFLKLPHVVMSSPAFLGLSAYAVKLLCDIGAQFRGRNNGDLGASWRVMQRRGWRSRDTLSRALKELRRAGLIELTRQGGINSCSLYALTWLSIDYCNGKLDVTPTNLPSGLWKENANTVSVSARHVGRVNAAARSQLPTREAC